MDEEKNQTENIQKEIDKYRRRNGILKVALVTLIIISIIYAIYQYILFIDYNEPRVVSEKPIIYIYPEEKTEVTVMVSNPENLTTTYPKYEDKWQVIAKPNGDLIDVKTGRSLYSLYWEDKRKTQPSFEEGFVVKGQDTASFLEEKLAILGLNEREAQEFIIYWLPKMESNPYNIIRFETIQEINEDMELNISPEPDTLIRVWMDFKAVNKWQEIPEQKLEQIERSGYTVVEWGGTEVK